MLNGHKSAECRYGNAVKFGTAVAKHHRKAFDKGIDILYRSSHQPGKTFTKLFIIHYYDY